MRELEFIIFEVLVINLDLHNSADQGAPNPNACNAIFTLLEFHKVDRYMIENIKGNLTITT